MNRTKTLVLLSVLTALVIWAGQAIGGKYGLAFGLVFAGMMNIGAYWFSDRIVLRMHGARELTPSDAPELHSMVRNISMRACLPMPRLYAIPEDAPNAFATGRSPRKGVVALTEGLLRRLNREEIAGVVAHELAHIKNRDTLIMSVAATLGGAISMIANAAMWGSLFGAGQQSDDEEGAHPAAGLLGIIVAPFVATMIRMAISRSREFVADEAAAQFTGNPLALASALRSIEGWSHSVPMNSGSPATAHLFIQNPFSGGGILRLFSTHPPTEARVARLVGMARGQFPNAA